MTKKQRHKAIHLKHWDSVPHVRGHSTRQKNCFLTHEIKFQSDNHTAHSWRGPLLTACYAPPPAPTLHTLTQLTAILHSSGQLGLIIWRIAMLLRYNQTCHPHSRRR